MNLPDDVAFWPAEFKELFEERAGIYEYEANMPRKEAEDLAEQTVRNLAKGYGRGA